MEIHIILSSIKLVIREINGLKKMSIKYASNYIHFRITGILSVNANGDTWPGDMAFDEFSVIEGVGDDLETINGYANSACDLSSAEIV